VATAYAAHPVRRGALADSASMRPAERVVCWGRTAGVPFAVGVVLMVIGGMGLRASGRRRRPSTALERGRAEAVVGVAATERARVALDRIRRELAALVHIDVGRERQATAERLDGVLETDVAQLLALRDALTDEVGLRRYAVFVGHVSSVERNVARAWSALTDGAGDECARSLERAQVAVGHALAQLPAGTEGAPAPS